MSKVKVAFAQIDYKPAFINGQINYLIEPLGNDETSISQFVFDGSQELKNELKKDYLSWLKAKVTFTMLSTH